jgi:hypothetical protein
MNKDRDYFYKILGLRTGASPAEIKSAYRKLVKLYHPDRDQSPDTAEMYREIRAAYKELLGQLLTDKAGTAKAPNSNFSNRTTQASNHSSGKAQRSATNSSGFSKQATWTSEEWEIWEKEHFSKHFSRNRKTQESIFSNVILSNVLLAFILAIMSCNSSSYEYGELAISYYIVSWVFFIFIRHYSTPSAWLLSMKFAAGILYGIILVFLITCFYTIPGRVILQTGVFAALSVWVLMIEFPIIPFPSRKWRV